MGLTNVIASIELQVKKAKKAKKEVDDVSKSLKKLGTAGKKGGADGAQGMRQMRNMGLSLGLGMLFLGMQIKKTFSGILKSTVGTFNRIMQESNNFGTATQQLAAHWEYLKFVIGSAVERFLIPLMPIIMKIINAISGWVNAHPKLTAGIIVFMVALGSLLMTLGVLLTPFWALTSMIGKLSKMFPIFGGILKGIGAIFSWWGLLVAAILIGIWVAWKDNFLNMKSFFSNFLDGIAQSFKGLKMIFSGILDIIVGLFTGNFDKVGAGIKTVIKGIGNFIVGFWKVIWNGIIIIGIGVIQLIKSLLNVLWGALKWIGNKILEFVLNPIDSIVSGIKSVMAWVKNLYNGEDGGLSEITPEINKNLELNSVAGNPSGDNSIKNEFGDINIEMVIPEGTDVDGELIGSSLMDEINRFTNTSGD